VDTLAPVRARRSEPQGEVGAGAAGNDQRNREREQSGDGEPPGTVAHTSPSTVCEASRVHVRAAAGARGRLVEAILSF